MTETLVRSYFSLNMLNIHRRKNDINDKTALEPKGFWDIDRRALVWLIPTGSHNPVQLYYSNSSENTVNKNIVVWTGK